MRALNKAVNSIVFNDMVRLNKEFAKEAIEIWDKNEQALPMFFSVFVNLYLHEKWKSLSLLN